MAASEAPSLGEARWGNVDLELLRRQRHRGDNLALRRHLIAQAKLDAIGSAGTDARPIARRRRWWWEGEEAILQTARRPFAFRGAAPGVLELGLAECRLEVDAHPLRFRQPAGVDQFACP